MAAKRDRQIGVRVSDRDLKMLRRAAEVLWPNAPITNSTMVLTLARLKAQEILKPKTPR